MELKEVLDRLRMEKGSVRVEIMPDDLCRMIVEEEATVTAAEGNMPVINTGLDEFMKRNTHICVFETEEFYTPPEITMKMIDEAGNVIGHDIPICAIPEYEGRSDITFISEDFVMYHEIPIEGVPSMDMLAVPYFGSDDWLPHDTDAIIWFSSCTSSDMIHDYFGEHKGNLATAMIALNL